MKISTLLAATFAATVVGGAAAKAATITLDGVADSAYGAPKAHVTYVPGTPDSNFGAPTMNTNYAGYSIYLSSNADYLYGLVIQDGTGKSAGAFTNLYFDIDPQIHTGSNLAFEVNNDDAFIPGQSIPNIALTGAEAIQTFVTTDGSAIEFAIPTIDFTTKIAGLDYGSTLMPTNGSPVTLRLSQTFGYSVAGTALGGATIGGVPEPASWALMLAGVGLMGGMLRLNRRKALAV